MKVTRMGLLIRALLIAFSFGLFTLGSDAFARAGGKRSFGQRSQPTAQPRSNPPPQQQMQPPAANRGGFMKGLAGGLAGGFIGSMLFSSLAHGAGGMGGGGGGIGIFEIILLAGLVYVGYRFWKNRQNQNRHAFAGAGPSMGGGSSMGYTSPVDTNSSMARNTSAADTGYFAQGSSSPQMASVSGPRLDRETAEDVFFRVQGAWTRRDLTSVQNYVERDVAQVLEGDLQDLKARHEINRLENISVRNIELSEPWYEGDRELVRVRFTASLLDYTVDETTSAIKSGSNTEPVKFDEYWVFAKSQGRSSWQLAGIEQI